MCLDGHAGSNGQKLDCILPREVCDGLQAALEAKEGLSIRPGGRILGSSLFSRDSGR